jgi:hypothetical protein
VNSRFPECYLTQCPVNVFTLANRQREAVSTTITAAQDAWPELFGLKG